MKALKKVGILVVLMLFTLSLAACGGGESDEKTAATDEKNAEN